MTTWQSPETVLGAFAAMLDNDLASDLQFKVREGQIVYAHKFVLAARCQHLYQVLKDLEALLVPRV